MAALAQGHLTGVEIFGQFVFADVVQQRLNDFPMREFHGLILIGEVFIVSFSGMSAIMASVNGALTGVRKSSKDLARTGS